MTETIGQAIKGLPPGTYYFQREEGFDPSHFHCEEKGCQEPRTYVRIVILRKAKSSSEKLSTGEIHTGDQIFTRQSWCDKHKPSQLEKEEGSGH